MSMAYLAQPEQQQQLEWLDGGTLAILLDGKATNGQLMVGRFDVSEGEAPPYHKHTREDEVFMLIKGTALLWLDDQEMELSEGGIVFLPKNIPHAYRITSKKADLLMINTPAGIEGMFRYAGRDKATPRPDGFEITARADGRGSGQVRTDHSWPPALTPPDKRGICPMRAIDQRYCRRRPGCSRNVVAERSLNFPLRRDDAIDRATARHPGIPG